MADFDQDAVDAAVIAMQPTIDAMQAEIDALKAQPPGGGRQAFKQVIHYDEHGVTTQEVWGITP